MDEFWGEPFARAVFFSRVKKKSVVRWCKFFWCLEFNVDPRKPLDLGDAEDPWSYWIVHDRFPWDESGIFADPWMVDFLW